ncbi:uncharacterized protein [Manis javanica]|uniref:uncharacterized protein isoform X3 n=1 Tax=Manis javanica TaxID=9974 RepID=UPI003C6D52A1
MALAWNRSSACKHQPRSLGRASEALLVNLGQRSPRVPHSRNGERRPSWVSAPAPTGVSLVLIHRPPMELSLSVCRMGTVPSPAAQPSCAAGPSPEVKLAEQAPRNLSGSERDSPGHPGAGGGGREGPEPEERSVGGTLVGAPAARDAAPGPPLAGPRLPPSPLNSPSLASRLCACPCRRCVRCASSRCRCHGCQGHRRAGPCAGCALSQRRARLKNNNRQVCIDPKLKWIQEYLEKALNNPWSHQRFLSFVSLSCRGWTLDGGTSATSSYPGTIQEVSGPSIMGLLNYT